MDIRETWRRKTPFPGLVLVVAASCGAWLLMGAKTGILLFALLLAASLITRQKG